MSKRESLFYCYCVILLKPMPQSVDCVLAYDLIHPVLSMFIIRFSTRGMNLFLVNSIPLHVVNSPITLIGTLQR